MKVLLVLATVIVAALAVGTEDQRKRIELFIAPCSEKFGMSIADFRAGLHGDSETPDPKVKDILLCTHKRIGLAKEDSEINREKIKERIQKISGDDAETEKMMKKCVLKKDTPEETTFQMVRCLSKNLPKWYPID